MYLSKYTIIKLQKVAIRKEQFFYKTQKVSERIKYIFKGYFSSDQN
jgi:hypothetical protein